MSHLSYDNQCVSAVADLRYLIRLRRPLVNATVALTNQQKGLMRLLESLAGDQRKNVTLVDAVSREAFAKPFVEAQEPIEKRKREIENQIAAAARRLPVWPWVKEVRGAGEVSLGLIVGEAGDLSNYANPAKLWKRFGLAPGQRRYADKAKAIEAGYNPQRRAIMYVISQNLVRGTGDYYVVYIERKAYLATRSPECSKIKRHEEAMRYIAKRFLRDLWRAWRKAELFLDPSDELPTPGAPDIAFTIEFDKEGRPFRKDIRTGEVAYMNGGGAD